ncbi:MAG: hypothetical protein H6731_11235 [Myxococcales bacterium]|nr:MAG: hypothetical protein H6731_11235 [Myxococcales bacterium]
MKCVFSSLNISKNGAHSQSQDFLQHYRNRRLVRNYEKNTKHQESMNYIANARLCIRRLENWLTT